MKKDLLTKHLLLEERLRLARKEQRKPKAFVIDRATVCPRCGQIIIVNVKIEVK